MWIFQDSVPKVNYQTVADKVIQATFVYLASVSFACFWIDREYKRNHDGALFLNGNACWLLPCSYLIVLVYIIARPLRVHIRAFRRTETLPRVKRKREISREIHCLEYK